MNTTANILFAVTGQPLAFDAPEGRPSSVTSVQVWLDAPSLQAFPYDGTTRDVPGLGAGDTSAAETAVGAGSVESTSLTFNAASGVSETDPTLLNLSAVTGLIRQRQYLVTNAYGEREWVEIERIDSTNTNAYARNPMQIECASADTLVSTRMTATVDSTWVADRAHLSDPLCPRPRWRAVWTYVVSGVTYRAASFFDLVRYPFTTTVTPTDVDRLSRGWLSRLSTDDRANSGEAVIAEAVFQVKLDLWERDLTAFAQRNSEIVNELIRLKAVALVADQAFFDGGGNSVGVSADPVRDAAHAAYWQRMDNLIGAAKVALQMTVDGASGLPSRSPIWRR